MAHDNGRDVALPWERNDEISVKDWVLWRCVEFFSDTVTEDDEALVVAYLQRRRCEWAGRHRGRGRPFEYWEGGRKGERRTQPFASGPLYNRRPYANRGANGAIESCWSVSRFMSGVLCLSMKTDGTEDRRAGVSHCTAA